MSHGVALGLLPPLPGQNLVDLAQYAQFGDEGTGTEGRKEVGWARGRELGKLARRDRQHFDCATWLHRARQMPKEDFKKAAERELAGKETEPWEIIYFKFYQSQMPVIEKAIETVAPDVGKRPIPRSLSRNDLRRFPGRGQPRQRGSGDVAVLDDEILQISSRRAAAGISRRLEREGLMNSIPKPVLLRLDPVAYKKLRQQVLRRDGWRCQSCGGMANLEIHHRQFRSLSGHDAEEKLITVCSRCHSWIHGHIQESAK